MLVLLQHESQTLRCCLRTSTGQLLHFPLSNASGSSLARTGIARGGIRATVATTMATAVFSSSTTAASSAFVTATCRSLAASATYTASSSASITATAATTRSLQAPYGSHCNNDRMGWPSRILAVHVCWLVDGGHYGHHHLQNIGPWLPRSRPRGPGSYAHFRWPPASARRRRIQRARYRLAARGSTREHGPHSNTQRLASSSHW